MGGGILKRGGWGRPRLGISLTVSRRRLHLPFLPSFFRLSFKALFSFTPFLFLFRVASLFHFPFSFKKQKRGSPVLGTPTTQLV